MAVFVEIDNKEKRLSFYKNYGFKHFDIRQAISSETVVFVSKWYEHRFYEGEKLKLHWLFHVSFDKIIE